MMMQTGLVSATTGTTLDTTTGEYSTTCFNTTSINNVTVNTTQAPTPQRPSLNELLLMWPEYRMSLDLGLYGSMTQIVVGTVTNTVTLAVMTRPSMITSTTCFYFALLAVADLLILYGSCLRRFLFVLNDSSDVYIKARWSCLLMDFASYLTYDLASWILVAMTIDRFVAVKYPLKAAEVCTIRNASLTMVAILLMCVAKNGHFFFTSTFTVNGNCGPVPEHRYFRDKVWPWLDTVFYSFLPFTLLLVFNSLIIHYHRLALRRKHSMTASVTLPSTASRRGFNQRLTVMLLTVSFTFMIMTAPKVILFSIREKVFTFVHPNGRIDFPQITRYSLISAVFSFLVWTNHIINFFLYCLSGRRFRKELYRMLTQCRHHDHRRQSLAFQHPMGQSATIPRRGSSTSTLSDDVASQPPHPPTECEDRISRVNRWASVTFSEHKPN